MGSRRTRAAVALPLAALLLSACAQQPTTSDDAGAPPGSWTTVPSAPLSPRLDAVTAWTGTEALVLGGAGPTGIAADGAAYDPEQETWRPIADAPYPVPGGTARAVSGDTVHLVHDDRLLSYDASEDAWSVSPPAPIGDLGRPAALDDGTVVVVDGERTAGEPSGQVYDQTSRTWSELPEDPLGPSFDRSLTAVPGGLVLTAVSTPADWEGAQPTLRAARLDTSSDTWTTLGDSGRTGGWHWAFTGERMVDVYPDGQGAEGGRFAQGGVLDPTTGTWSDLPDAPEMGTGGWPAEALDGPVAAVDGWVYDDRDRSWTLLERPSGAPAVPGSAVWAGDELLVLGGMDTDEGWDAEHLTGRAWLWRPPGRRPALDTDGLTGVHWVLESPVAPGTASLDFRDDGTVDVDTGCVGGTTTWHTSGDTVSIDEFGWAGLSCNEDEFDGQGPLFDTWSSFRPSVDGDVLTLVPTADGAPILDYRAD